MSKELKVGIIGTGAIADIKHGPGYQDLEDASIVAACDLVEERVEKFAGKFDVPHTFTDYEKMLEMDELDAVSVCTWNRAHADPTIAALEAGKDVLCEKPLAHNAADGERMVEAAERTGSVLQIGLQSRFKPGNIALKQLFDEGTFGDVYYGRAMAVRRRGIPVGSFIEESKAGGGCLIDIGVHILDCLLWIIGYPKPVEAFGSVATKFGKREEVINPNAWGTGERDPDLFSVEDFGVGQIRFEDGLTVTLETSWASHVEESGKTFFMGDRAGATLTPPKIFTDTEDKMIGYSPAAAVNEAGTSSEFLGEFESFQKAVWEGGPSPVPAEEVLTTAKIFDAIYESAEKGGAVEIEA